MRSDAFATTAVNARTDAELESGGPPLCPCRCAARHLGPASHSPARAGPCSGGPRPASSAAAAGGRQPARVGKAARSLQAEQPRREAASGSTDAYGAIAVARDQSLTEQRLTLLHELVHRFFSPRTGPLRQLRAELNMSAYSRSALLRYLEEALAEGYAELRVNGLARALAAYRFPLQGGYVTLARLGVEGAAIGNNHARRATLRRVDIQQAHGGGPMIDRDGAIEIARARAAENGWAFAEPLEVLHRRGWFGQSDRFEIETNAGTAGPRLGS